MGKDNPKNLVGQPIFKQMVKMLPKEKFDLLVRQQKSDKGYRALALLIKYIFVSLQKNNNI